jgi:hypothetical protein
MAGTIYETRSNRRAGSRVVDGTRTQGCVWPVGRADAAAGRGATVGGAGRPSLAVNSQAFNAKRLPFVRAQGDLQGAACTHH